LSLISPIYAATLRRQYRCRHFRFSPLRFDTAGRHLIRRQLFTFSPMPAILISFTPIHGYEIAIEAFAFASLRRH
jgi:hypothetical protein